MCQATGGVSCISWFWVTDGCTEAIAVWVSSRSRATKRGDGFDKTSGLRPLSGPDKVAQADGAMTAFVASAMAFQTAEAGSDHLNLWIQDR